MKNCGDCLYQGDKISDEHGNCNVFCLVKGNWFKDDTTCGFFREYADLGKEIRTRLASEIRQEEAEDRRLKKIVKANMYLIGVTMVVSFALFILTVKFFDKYIF
jgi:hypothetical protein